ncbi:hypothetical protein [Comamonas testosteroni]|uniref:hypothetical protein n=1 Tax=Comamonas testosteroni TaxID=285 RepID=UPI0005B36E1F|nr:hypothetical protein [Comamonas testosteroni]
MKTLFVLAALAAATTARAEVPVGRFMQDIATGYRDIEISRDRKTATWLTKGCIECREIKSRPEKVTDLHNGWIAIGKAEFQVVSSEALFHPSMGDFGSSYKRY